VTLDLPDAPNPAALEGTSDITPAVAPTTPDTVAATPDIENHSTPDATSSLPLELGLIDQLWALYREQLSASLDQQAAAEKLEIARQQYDEAKEKNEARRAAVQEFLATFLDQLSAIRDPHAAAIAQSVADSIAEHEASQEQRAEAEPEVGCTSMDWEEWRKIPTSELVKQKIAGLGEKKAEALVEKFPTLGDLEDARTEAGKAHKHFCKALVKGIGEQTADAIMDAMQARLKIKGAAPKPAPVATVADQQPGVDAPQVTPESTREVSEPEFTDAEGGPTLDVDDEDELAKLGGDVDDWTDPNADDDILYSDADSDDEPEIAVEAEDDETPWAEAYYRQILNDPAEVKAAWGANDKKQSAAWTTGNTSYEDWPVESCPFDETKELDQAKDWVRGWTAASVLQMDL
jgi:hypothetical protein